MSDEAEKKAFAQALVDCNNDASKASKLIFPSEMARAMVAQNRWVIDDVVINELKRLTEEAPTIFLASKEKFCKDLYDMFEDTTLRASDRLVASNQFAQIMGYVSKEKGETTINNKVMIVTRSLSDEEWETKSKRNQENLMNGIIEVKAVDVTDDK